MDPVTAAILIGAVTSYQSQQSANAQRSAQKAEHLRGVANENAAVEGDFKKKVQGAQGLGGGFAKPQPLGNNASQKGGILDEQKDINANSILG